MYSPSPANLTRVCLTLPPKVQSLGLWKQYLSKSTPGDPTSIDYHWLDFTLPRLELTIAFIFIITQSFHYILKRFRFPLLTSQLLAGVFLSPAVLPEKLIKQLMTERNVQMVGTIGSFGFAFYLFLMGVKMDPTVVTKVSRRALYVGVLSVLAPLAVVVVTPPAFNLDHWKALYISLGYVTTSFPAVSCLLDHLHITNSELGRMGLSAATVSDVFTFVSVFSISLAGKAVQVSFQSFARDAFFVGAFIFIVFFIIRPVMKLVANYTPEGKPVQPVAVSILTALFLLSVCINRWFPQFALLAPYILGLAVPHGPPLGSVFVEKLEGMVEHLLMPLFVTSCGMRLSTFNVFGGIDTFAGGNALMAAAATVVKFVVCLLPPLYSEMPTRDAVGLACIMSCKGVVELLVFANFSDRRIIGKELYSFMFALVICAASLTPLLVKALHDPSRRYSGYYKRNILDLKANSELKIVACIHVPDNVRAVINLLDVSSPTKDNAMVVNVLHLVKLRGQVTPIFISHQKRRKQHVACSYSENVVISFRKFEKCNWGTTIVNAFTAVSPPSLMHDDVCMLALDQFVSLIILPFHRRWYIDGSIESDDDSVRVLNSRVLEKAPCSVGILIDGGNLLRRQPQDTSIEPAYSVAVIFMGGPDDREALTLAKRMAQGSRVCLTVIHLMAATDYGEDFEDWNKVLDSVMLRDVKTNGYMNYIEKVVNDGPETTKVLKSMVNEFDLIIVGRSYNYNLESLQTSGLKDWSEFPELGALGDLLATMESNNARSSALVVQQQQQIQKPFSLD